MSDPAWRQMQQLVREGFIGRPLFGETGFFRVGDWGERGMEVPDPTAQPGPDLHWEAFLGDTPQRERRSLRPLAPVRGLRGRAGH